MPAIEPFNVVIPDAGLIDLRLHLHAHRIPLAEELPPCHRQRSRRSTVVTCTWPTGTASERQSQESAFTS